MNFLLVGNSRLHWAEYVQSEYKFFHTNKNDTLPENININKIIWASVGENPKFILKKENEIKTKDIRLSNLPDFFGVDRALSCLAALKIIENPLKKKFANCRFWHHIINNKIKSKWSYSRWSTYSRFSDTVEINATKYKKSQNSPKI